MSRKNSSKPDDQAHLYDYYWDLSMHVPRLYVEPFRCKLHDSAVDQSDAEHRMEKILTPLLEEIVTTEKLDQIGKAIQVKNEPERILIYFNVKHFEPDDLSIRTIESMLIVEGSHGELIEKNHHQLNEKFIRKFLLPQDAYPKGITALISQEGILTIEVPKKSLSPSSPIGKEHFFQIENHKQPAS